MKTIWLAVLVAALGGLAACAHKGPPPGTLQLKTRITDDGLKLFELVFPMPNRPLEMPSGGGERRKPRPDLSGKQMLALLDEVVTQSQFCRQGYVLLGRYAGETTARLRGECNDRATTADRDRFPDTINRW